MQFQSPTTKVQLEGITEATSESSVVQPFDDPKDEGRLSGSVNASEWEDPLPEPGTSSSSRRLRGGRRGFSSQFKVFMKNFGTGSSGNSNDGTSGSNKPSFSRVFRKLSLNNAKSSSNYKRSKSTPDFDQQKDLPPGMRPILFPQFRSLRRNKKFKRTLSSLEEKRVANLHSDAFAVPLNTEIVTKLERSLSGQVRSSTSERPSITIESLDRAQSMRAAHSQTGFCRRSQLRYRNRQNQDMAEEDDLLSSKDFRMSTVGNLSSELGSCFGHGLSTSALQASLDHEARSESFRQSNQLAGAHGTEAWHQLIRPFVSDLAFHSIVKRKSESAVCFDPYTCEAAVLFVDLSGYSKITSAVAHRGAHAISSAVNAYLDRLLRIIDRYGGDVIKFAGDAVLVVWAGQEGDDDELEYNLLCASKCALELQRQAGEHPVKGTEHSFRIHCGLCCGMLESEIFAAPSHVHMQRLFHSMSGQCLVEISELVDLAKSGQIAISEDVADYLGTRGTFEPIRNVLGATLLVDLEMDLVVIEAMDQHIVDSKADRAKRRINGSEEDFIHPNVLRLLRYGGLSPTQIAQMRNLCVLFIGMTSSGSSVNWLMEVQAVLDRHRCPIIQIIDDDKGTHVVAAVNLCESVPESAVLGLDACRELVSQQIGCAIGVAMGKYCIEDGLLTTLKFSLLIECRFPFAPVLTGSTFCGVTGSSGIACRWDITGPHPVRAARLMQYAVQKNVPVAIDSTLLNDPMAATKMTLIEPAVFIKGSPELCAVYGLSASKVHSVFRILETTPGITQTKAVQQVRKCINAGRTRCAVILTGAPFTGKKPVCRKAACKYIYTTPYLMLPDSTLLTLSTLALFCPITQP